MKKAIAVQHLRTIMLILQRFRETVQRDFEVKPEDMHSLNEWIYGDKCLIPAIAGILDRYETTGTLAPLDYYNIRFAIWRFCPEAVMGSGIVDAYLPKEGQYPQDAPEVSILKGFEE